MRKFIPFILLLFLLIGCDYNKPYYIVNKTNDSVRLELELLYQKDTSRLCLKHIPQTDITRELNRRDWGMADKLKLFVKNKNVFYVNIPPKSMLLLTHVSSFQEGETYYPVRNHTFIRNGNIYSCNIESFYNRLVGQYWYQMMYIQKSYFIYK